VHRRISNVDVMGKHLTVTFFMILPSEKKSLYKNIRIVLKPFPSHWRVRVTSPLVDLPSLIPARRIPARGRLKIIYY